MSAPPDGDAGSTALADLADLPLWVGWGTVEGNATAPPKKMPVDPATGRWAMTDAPRTWGTRARAETAARRHGLAGIGIILGDIGGGFALVGIDLDTCRDPADGIFTPWALEVIERFDSYTEISPSGTGAKVFFRLRTADLTALLADIRAPGDENCGKKWAGGGGDHPPAIELYLGKRYFTVTGQRPGSAPAELRTVDPETVRWLIREAGPALAARADTANGHDKATAPHDNSRSAIAFRKGLALRQGGKTYQEMCAALRDDPETAAWYREKGTAHGERELMRIWERADRIVTAPPYQIDPAAPLMTAQRLREIRYDLDDTPTLYYHHGGFCAWNGAAYLEIEDAEIRAKVYQFLDECVVPVKTKAGWTQAPVNPNAARVNNVLDALRAATLLPGTVAAAAWLDQRTDPVARNVIACANGLLSLETMAPLPHTPLFFTRNALDYSYDTHAPAPAAWLAFLGQLWPDDTESIATLQEVFGYYLTADTSQQKAVLLVGPKRSGKGTIARVLTRLVGADNAVSPTLAGIGTNFGLAPLIGKRVAIISDARLSGRADQAVIAERLLSITGEDGITIDRKYRDAWTGRLGVRFLVLTNELPRLADASGALASRFIVLVLTRSFFGEEDPGLTNRLLAELPGILNWAVEGWRRLRERGYFVQPAAALEVVGELEDLGSPIGAFLRDRCEIGAGLSVSVDHLFTAWEAWCTEQRRERPGDRQTFGRNLRAAVPGLRASRPRTESGERERQYEGIALLPPPVWDDAPRGGDIPW